MKLCIIKIASEKSRIGQILKKALAVWGGETEFLCSFEDFMSEADSGRLQNRKIIFAVEIPKSGINLEAYRIIDYLQGSGEETLRGSVGGVVVDGQTQLYTKDMGRRLIFAANLTGCTFPGKPLTEATESLSNFKVLSRLWQTNLDGAYLNSCLELIKKIWEFKSEPCEKPKILVIHAGSHKTSNSLALWSMTAAHLKNRAYVEEISVRNGQVWDCRGCKYEDCLHFGEKGDCFYGGVMVEKVYPAIIKCDIMILLCPNYNDSVSANIMAFINRLTAVFRANDFSKKKVYAIVVSGYSGGDIVAQQIIGAININKSFILPAGFAMMETANDPGDVEKIQDIDSKAEKFAERILEK